MNDYFQQEAEFQKNDLDSLHSFCETDFTQKKKDFYYKGVMF